MKIALQMVRMPVVPASRPTISVVAARRAAPLLKVTSSLSRFLVRPVPLDSDDLKFGWEPVVYSFLFGPNANGPISHRLGKLSARRDPLPYVDAKLDWLDLSNPDKIQLAVETFMERPRFKANADIKEAQRQGIADWDSRAQRDRRRIMTLQLNMQLPIDREFFAERRGEQILGPALKMAALRLKEALRLNKPVLHRDGVPHFCFDELRRTELSELPLAFVQLR